MSRRLNVKLSSFNLTKRPTSGRVTHHLVHRGCSSLQSERSLEEPSEISSGNQSNGQESLDDHVLDDNVPLNNHPTLHQIFQKQAIESWGRIRSDLLRVTIESRALPENEVYFVCEEEKATHRYRLAVKCRVK